MHPVLPHPQRYNFKAPNSSLHPPLQHLLLRLHMHRWRTPRGQVRVVALVTPARVLGDLIQLVARLAGMCRWRSGRGREVSGLLMRMRGHVWTELRVRGVRWRWRGVITSLSLRRGRRVVAAGSRGTRVVPGLDGLFRGEPGSAEERSITSATSAPCGAHCE